MIDSIVDIRLVGKDTFTVELFDKEGEHAVVRTFNLSAEVLLNYRKFTDWLTWRPGQPSYDTGGGLEASWDAWQPKIREWLSQQSNDQPKEKGSV